MLLLPKEFYKLFQMIIWLIYERGKVMEKRLFIRRGGEYKLLIIEQFIHSTFLPYLLPLKCIKYGR